MFEILAERKILEARARGEFEALPGAGQPLDLDEFPLVPPEVRVAHRILKNSGCVPPEVAQLQEVNCVARSLANAVDDEARRRALRKLQALSLALAESGPPRRGGLQIEPRYYARIIDRFA